jgi:hypothetical protein
MIVRILGEGQYEVPDGSLGELDGLDTTVQRACEADDHPGFDAALAALLSRVRELGTPVPEEYLGPSELVLPRAGATLAEVSELLGSGEGLIHG